MGEIEEIPDDASDTKEEFAEDKKFVIEKKDKKSDTEENEEDDPEELFEEEETRDTFTKPDYVPPPPKNPERPAALFDPNLVGLAGFLITALYFYILRETRPLLEAGGVSLTGDVSTTVILMASIWSFTSNLEGWTRFPYITCLFVICGFFAPGLDYLLKFDASTLGFEFNILYNVILYGPLFYITMSTAFAIANGRNELAHGFNSNFF